MLRTLRCTEVQGCSAYSTGQRHSEARLLSLLLSTKAARPIKAPILASVCVLWQQPDIKLPSQSTRTLRLRLCYNLQVSRMNR